MTSDLAVWNTTGWGIWHVCHFSWRYYFQAPLQSLISKFTIIKIHMLWLPVDLNISERGLLHSHPAYGLSRSIWVGSSGIRIWIRWIWGLIHQDFAYVLRLFQIPQWLLGWLWACCEFGGWKGSAWEVKEYLAVSQTQPLFWGCWVACKIKGVVRWGVGKRCEWKKGQLLKEAGSSD